MIWLLLSILAGAASNAASHTYWIEPCSRPETSCESGDVDLAEWALQAWQKASAGALTLEKTPDLQKARIRIYWATGREGFYGEARPIQVNGQSGAEVYVRPDIRQFGPEIAAAARKDPLFRDTIVYVTCLHETGHALGLSHTDAFEDIMYYFGYGGDITEYFQRYRRKLRSRKQIRQESGISPADQQRLAKILKE